MVNSYNQLSSVVLNYWFMYLQVKASLESELSTHKSSADSYKSETERLTLELGELRGQLRVARETADRSKAQLGEVLKTAKIDQSSDDVIEQLHEQLRSLHKQVC